MYGLIYMLHDKLRGDAENNQQNSVKNDTKFFLFFFIL